MRTKSDYTIYPIPAVIAVGHGVLSVFGGSQGLEYLFWGGALLSGAILLGLSQKNNLLLPSMIIGLLISAGTGLPQAVFIEMYFENNPEYKMAGETLSMAPQIFTLVMIPVFAVVIGLIILLISWMISKLKSS